MSNIGNKALSGSEGQVWLNGELLGEVKSIELKVTGSFEEISICGDYATYQRYTGWSGEGTLKLQKVYSRGSKLLANAYKTGIMPDIKIVTKLTDKSTGKSERVSVEDVTITEFMLTNFENKSLIEEELPLKFAKYNPIESI
jgi:hypothetical protein